MHHEMKCVDDAIGSAKGPSTSNCRENRSIKVYKPEYKNFIECQKARKIEIQRHRRPRRVQVSEAQVPMRLEGAGVAST